MIVMRINTARAVFVAVLGLLADPAGANQEGTDRKLEDAGFKIRSADTVEKLTHARLLPPRKFISRTKDGHRYYVYSDPDVCKCVFVGDELAMKTYRDMTAPPGNLPPGVVPPSVTAGGMNPSSMIEQEMDSDVSSMIGDGNILNWKF